MALARAAWSKLWIAWVVPLSMFSVFGVTNVIGVIGAPGCYEDPDYLAAQFKCDSEHGCPDGQTCVNGRCGGSETASDGVACNGTVCKDGNKCCVDAESRVGTCIAPNATCDIGPVASCDGVEDCAGGACCQSASDSAAFACGPAMCEHQACLDASDCLNPSALQCCTMTGLPAPWGICFASCPVISTAMPAADR